MSDDLPRDDPPQLTPEQHRTQRGQRPDKTEDRHPNRRRRFTLPDPDPNFQPHQPSGAFREAAQKVARGRRIHSLFPYLLVRAVPGDHGARPLWPPTPFWESCDIHLMDPAEAAFDFSRTVINPIPGRRYSVWVHVWNLGRGPSFGVRVRAWWVEPGFFTPGNPNYPLHDIGAAWAQLGDRDSGRDAHRVVRLEPPWTVAGNPELHECLLVGVESATDPWARGANDAVVLDANGRRHVAQRNLTLVGAGDDAGPAVAGLAAAAVDAVAGGAQLTQLVVFASPAVRAGLTGAKSAGVSSRVRVPGWDRSGLAVNRRTSGMVAIRWEGGRVVAHDLDGRRAVPRLEDDLAGGQVIAGDLGDELPRLLQGSVGVGDLSGAAVARAVTGRPDRAAMVRFALSDTDGATAGYSLLAAPAEPVRRGPLPP